MDPEVFHCTFSRIYPLQKALACSFGNTYNYLSSAFLPLRGYLRIRFHNLDITGSYNYRIPCLSAFENPGLFNSLGLFIDWGAREYVVYEWHADG